MAPHALFQIVDLLFQALYLALLARILLSWIPHNPYHPIVEALYRVTDPILKPFRDLIPPLGGIDISPIFAFFALGLLQKIVFRILLALF